MYYLDPQGVIYDEQKVVVPEDDKDPSYIRYLAWLRKGNTLEQIDTPDGNGVSE